MFMRKLAVALFVASLVVPATAQQRSGEGRYDRQILSGVNDNLQKKATFEKVKATVEDGIVTLEGTVNLYIDKVNAEKQARKVKNVDGVRNRIQVAGAAVPDKDLHEKLAAKLRYDRIGQGIVFNTLTLGVENGTVTVGGNVRDYPDRDSVIAIVETTPGVKDVIDEIDVAPVSTVDDDLRLRLARAIYGHSALQKYAVDPMAPIRIVVENGKVSLHGVVLSKSDKQIAYMQAQSVPGAFAVTDNLMVASEAIR